MLMATLFIFVLLHMVLLFLDQMTRKDSWRSCYINSGR